MHPSLRPAPRPARLPPLALLALFAACAPSTPATKGADSAAPSDTASDSADSADSAVDTADSGVDTADTADTGETGDTAIVPSGPPAIILFIGDGMGPDHVRGGGLYANGAAGSLHMETLPVQGQLKTASLTGYTDSAAAATTLATGHKTWNGTVGLDRDLAALTTILEQARAMGLSTGILTTDALTGATPASFLSHVEDRGMTGEIATAMVANLPEVMMGGGRITFESLIDASAVQVVFDADGLVAAVDDGRPLVGLFNNGPLEYVAEGSETEPTLAQMVEVALARLDNDEDGFVLVVEGARIDHASHANLSERVHQETVAFDEAIAVAMAWTEDAPFEHTLVVTADHECGGLLVEDGTAAGELPESSWLWGDHTNRDVQVFADGWGADVLHDERLDNSWVHAVLMAGLEQRSVEAPDLPRVADGDTTDLGDVVATQDHGSSFGAGFNQLDALRLTADEDGLWIGLDGVFEGERNAVMVLIDLDQGASTGFGQDGYALNDLDGPLDTAITALEIEPDLEGLGFEAVLGTLGAAYARSGSLQDLSGLRGISGDIGEPEDLWWMDAVINFDSGNVARGDVAEDAGATGATEGGFEGRVPWDSLFPDGLPSDGTSLAIVAVLTSDDGQSFSNQALPALDDADAPEGVLTITAAAVLDVDALGVATGEASLWESRR